MIVKMNKVFLVVMDAHREESLKKLKKLGVMHINPFKVSSDTLEDLEEQRVKIDRALMILPPDECPEAEEYTSQEDALSTAGEILETADEIRRRQEELDRMLRESDRLKVWGDFSPRDIAILREKGVDLRLFSIPPEKVDALEGYPVFPITKTKTIHYLAAVIPEEDIPGEICELPLPEHGPSELQKLIEKKEENLRELHDTMKGYLRHRAKLEKSLEYFDDSIRFETVLESFSEEEELSYLCGFIPVTKTDDLKIAAQKNGWALLITEPSEDDQVPTLVQNNKFVRMIQPVFDLLGTTPGYHEYDISMWFLIFLSFFFAMIIGDAGYGCIFLLLSIFVRIKTGKASDIVRLLMLFSGTTIAWGAVTGTWFGSEMFADMAPFKYLIIKPISSFNPASGETVKMICFITGTVHLFLAHLQNFIKKLPDLQAFAEFGWLVMILGLYYLVLNLVLDPVKYPMPAYALYMIAGGLGAVIVFGQQGSGVNFFKGVIKGIGGLLTTFLDGISAFSDIISYIRLYAVGLATVAIAQSFNQMASGLGNGIVAIVGGAVILLFGHTLNLAMGALSVVVHGVRLNMLEFSGHLGMEWTGIKYEPFREISEN